MVDFGRCRTGKICLGRFGRSYGIVILLPCVLLEQILAPVDSRRPIYVTLVYRIQSLSLRRDDSVRRKLAGRLSHHPVARRKFVAGGGTQSTPSQGDTLIYGVR